MPAAIMTPASRFLPRTDIARTSATMTEPTTATRAHIAETSVPVSESVAETLRYTSSFAVILKSPQSIEEMPRTRAITESSSAASAT